MTETQTSLKTARQQGKVDQFAKERDEAPPGDQAAFDATLQSMAGKSKEAPGASTPERGDD